MSDYFKVETNISFFPVSLISDEKPVTNPSKLVHNIDFMDPISIFTVLKNWQARVPHYRYVYR